MTKPDGALLWARKDWVKGLKSKGARNDTHRGLWDECLDDAARGYRAGAAASEARIKALEAALQDVVADYDWVCDDPVDRDWNVLDNTIIRARALLKESDQ